MFSGGELSRWAGRRWLTGAGIVMGIGLLYGIYYMADHNLFPTSCGDSGRVVSSSYDPCDVFDTKEVCSAKIIAKEIRDSQQKQPETVYVSSPKTVRYYEPSAPTSKTATIKVSPTQFVIVDYTSSCTVTFESAKLARLEQP